MVDSLPGYVCFCALICVSFGVLPPWKVYNGTHIEYTGAYADLTALPDSLTHLKYINTANVSWNVSNETFSQCNPKCLPLQKLDLGGNAITSVSRHAFSHLSSLLNLSLAQNRHLKQYDINCSWSLELNVDVFAGLHNLMYLDLTLIGMRDLNPEMLRPLKKLETLAIGKNCLAELQDETFNGLQELKVLDLSYTTIKSLPSMVFSKLNKLETLLLYRTRLMNIPNVALAPLVNLRYLIISGYFTTIQFGEQFKNITRLQMVSLRTYYYNNTEEEHTEMNITNTSFEHLQTEAFEIHQDQGVGANGVKNLLRYPPDTKNLSLNWVHGLSSRSLNRTYFNVSKSRVVDFVSLDLSHTNLAGIKNETFIDLPNLQVLNLSYNILSFFDVYVHAFKGLEKLEILDLSSNSLIWVPSLKDFKNGSLKVLYLNDNELDRRIFSNVFSIVPTLRELHLRRTRLGNSYLYWLYNLTNLRVLDLSENYFKNFETLTTALSNLTLLEELNLARNPLQFLNKKVYLKKLKKLKSLNLSGTFFDFYWLIAFNLTSLEELYLENLENGDFFDITWQKMNLSLENLKIFSLAGSLVRTLSPQFFSSMPALKHLSLQANGLDFLNKDMLKNLKHLEYLDLSLNSITKITRFDFPDSLVTLILSYNHLSIIEREELNSGELLNLKTLVLSQNSLECSCPARWFRNWIHSNKMVNLVNYDKYICLSPSGGRAFFTAFNFDNLKCESLSYIHLAISLSCVAVIIFAVVCIAVYNRWYIRYACFLLRLKTRGYRELVDLDEKTYDAFISYNSADQNWVLRNLVPCLESDKYRFNICVDYKNFIPGKFIVDNIMDSIQESRKTILVLSENFVNSEWCYFEMNMALHRLFDDGRDVVVMILLEPIVGKKLPRILRKVFTKKTYIEWPQDHSTTAKELFWAKLENALKAPSRVDRVHKV
ncbi:toll-like receptor 2 type-1 [Saccoglossus kowalevskii]